MVSDKKNVVVFKGTALPSKDLGSGFEKALERASNSIDISSGSNFLKMDRGTGDWEYGVGKTEVQDGSEWAINPKSFERGFIAWKKAGTGTGGGQPPRKMRNIENGEVAYSELPEISPEREWSENISFQLQCLNGEDTGTTVSFDSSSRGGLKAWHALTLMMRKQIKEDRTKMVPVVELKSSSYPNQKYGGKTFEPIFQLKRWMAYDGGEEPAQPEASPEDESPESTTPVEAASASTNGAGRRRAAATVVDVEEVETAKAAPAAAADPVQRRRRRQAAS